MSHIDKVLRPGGRGAAPLSDVMAEFVITEGPSASRVDPVPPSRALVRRERSRYAVTPMPPVRRTSADDIRVLDVVHALYRRKWMVAAIVIAVEALAIAYVYLATPIYEARARLLVEPTYPTVVPFRPVVEEDRNSFEFYQTQVEVLRSRELAKKSLENMKRLSTGPDSSGQIGAFVGSVAIAPVTRSHLIDVGFRSPDPEFAATAANALAQAYIEQKLEASVRASREASVWLTERLAELRQQVESSANALQRFSEGTEDAISLENRQSIVIQKLAQLNAAVTNARTERIGKQILYEQLRAIENSGAPLDTFSPILTSPFIQSQKTELGTLQRERAQLAERLGSDHPEMIRSEAAIATTEARLAVETRKIVEGIRNDFTAAQANERSLIGALEEQKEEVQALNRDSIGWGALERDATSNKQIYESVLQRFREAELAGGVRSNNARILDRAQVPDRPISPRTWLILLVALGSGSFLAVGLVVGTQYLKPRIDTPTDVGAALELSLLGITPKADLKGTVGRIDADDFPPALRDAIRGIRARILQASGAGAQSLAVTSARGGEGKTLLASNIAISIALVGRRVLLVDGDMRRPRIHHVFNIPDRPGFSEVLAGTVPISAAVRDSGIEGLTLLPAGAFSESTFNLLDIESVGRLIDELEYSFDVVVIDCPPVLGTSDASIIATAASAAVFVVGAGTTSVDIAQVALQRLASSHVHVIGAVLNNVNAKTGEYLYYSSEGAHSLRPRGNEKS